MTSLKWKSEFSRPSSGRNRCGKCLRFSGRGGGGQALVDAAWGWGLNREHLAAHSVELIALSQWLSGGGYSTSQPILDAIAVMNFGDSVAVRGTNESMGL